MDVGSLRIKGLNLHIEMIIQLYDIMTLPKFSEYLKDSGWLGSD